MTAIFSILGIFALIIFFIFGLTAFTGAPYVPTLNSEIEEAFIKLIKLSKNDLVIDLGSGNGRVLRAAANHRAKALGVEINPILVLISIFQCRKYKDIKIKWSTYCTVPFPSETTVIYLFAADKDLQRIIKRINSEANRLNKTLKVISYGFKINSLEPIKSHRAFFLYEVKPN